MAKALIKRDRFAVHSALAPGWLLQNANEITSTKLYINSNNLLNDCVNCNRNSNLQPEIEINE